MAKKDKRKKDKRKKDKRKKDKRKKDKRKKDKRKKDKHSKFTAKTADRHLLYEESVQNVEEEIKFLTKAYSDLRGRPAVTLREDFAGTTAAACEWVRTSDHRRAWAVDFDPEVLKWGREQHIKKLSVEQQQRIEQIEGNVLTTKTPLADLIVAFNFSYFTFQTRDQLRSYFEQARRNLQPDGLFMLDCFGGSEALDECEEETEQDDFTYVWHQATFDPISAYMRCHIHFHFPDGSKMRKAFSYEWRMWTLPEVRELLNEAGFRNSTVYWEGTGEDGEGNDEYAPAERGDADPAWIAYIVAER